MSATQSAAPSRSLPASFPARFIAPRIGAAVAAFGLLFTANHAAAQQPFQLPASIGPINSLTDPIEIVGGRMLIRQNVTGGDRIGFVDGVTTTLFTPTFNVADSLQMPDPRLQRGAVGLPTNVFGTFPNLFGTRDLTTAPVATGARSTLLSLPAGNWQLQAMNANSTVFFLLDRSAFPHRVGRVTLTPSVQFTLVGNVAIGATLFDAQALTLSPNGQTLAIRTAPGFPTGPNDVLTMSTTSGVVTNRLAGMSVRSSLRWLDDRFLACIAIQAAPLPPLPQLTRIDAQAVNVVAALTRAPVQVDTSSDFAISEDRQWLTFVVSQTVRDTPTLPQVPSQAPEKTPVVMRVSTGATADPGGAYIVAGDYRNALAAPPTALTAWNFIGKPQIQSPIAGSAARIVFSGRRVFGASIEYFRFEVIDETQVTPRPLPGTTFAFDTIAPPAGVAWGMFGSLGEEVTPIRERATAPIAVPGIFNTVLIVNPLALFTVLTTPGAGVSVPLTVPPDPAFVGARFYLQGLWLNTDSSLHVSSVTELPFF